MAEITIFGAGVFGLSIAWSALKRGARVTVIDPNGPGAGASGGLVGALQPHTPDPWNTKKQFQFESLILSRSFWTEVDAMSGLNSGYGQVGRLCPLLTDKDVELALQRAGPAKLNWQGRATWEVIEAPETPLCPPSPTGLYLHDTLSAILNPRLAVESLARAVVAAGGTLLTDGPERGSVIWATGWEGLMHLTDVLAKPVGNGVKGQALLLDYDAAGAPQVYADGLHIIPHLAGGVAIGSTSERDFDAPTTTDDQLDDILTRAAALCPVLADASVKTRWAGVRPRAQSRAPLLGPWPGRPNHFIANGGFKIGFGMAPKCTEVLLDQVLDGTDTIPDAFHTRHLT